MEIVSVHIDALLIYINFYQQVLFLGYSELQVAPVLMTQCVCTFHHLRRNFRFLSGSSHLQKPLRPNLQNRHHCSRLHHCPQCQVSRCPGLVARTFFCMVCNTLQHILIPKGNWEMHVLS